MKILISSLAIVAALLSSPVQSKPLAVATTTMIHDLVSQIGGDKIDVQGILAPGSDPHTYKPVPGDARLIANAQIVFRNGLKLEGWMDKLVENAGGSRPIATVSDGITALDDPAQAGHPDPHIWFSVPFWKSAADNVTRALAQLLPAEKSYFETRAQNYKRQLDSLHAWARAEMARIPESRRYLVTSHDAFNYFGNEYGVTVIGVQGISTETQASSQDVAAIVKFIKQHQVPAIFIETSVNPKLIEEIARQSGARVGGVLYGDSAGPVGSGAETYIGMLSANVRTIIAALGANP